MRVLSINDLILIKRGVFKRRLYMIGPDGIFELPFYKWKKLKKDAK